jgi:hypothetical protein
MARLCLTITIKSMVNGQLVDNPKAKFRLVVNYVLEGGWNMELER